MDTIKTIYSSDKKCRVVIYEREDGTYGFEDERFSEDPLEMAWCPRAGYCLSISDSPEAAEREARERVEWLANQSR